MFLRRDISQFLVFFLLFIFCFKFDALASGGRFALLIGNQDYRDGELAPLQNPITDVERLGTELEAYSFQVTIVTNLSDRAAMERAASDFARKIEATGDGDKAEVVLVHYAGHGLEIRGENFLVPTAIDSGGDLAGAAEQFFPLSNLIKSVEPLAEKRLILVDACRTPLFAEDSLTPSVSGLDLDYGTEIVYAASPGATAADGTAGQSTEFINSLIYHIQVENKDFREIKEAIDKDVLERSGGQQKLAFAGELGAFSFRQANHELDEQARLARRSMVDDVDDGDPVRIAVVGHLDLVPSNHRAFELEPDRWAMALPLNLVQPITHLLGQSTEDVIDIVPQADLTAAIRNNTIDRGDDDLKEDFPADFGDLGEPGADLFRPRGSSFNGAAQTMLENELANVGSTINADYIVHGRLEQLPYDVTSRRLPDEPAEYTSARLRLHMIDVARADVVTTAVLETQLEPDVFDMGPESAQSSMFDELAREANRWIADAVAPARIVATEPLIIDRGEAHGIREGDVFAILREQPDTTRAEGGDIRVGQVTVKKVDAQTATVQRLMGDNEPRERDKATLQRANDPAMASDSAGLEIEEIYLKPAFRKSELVGEMGQDALEEQFGTKFADGLEQSSRFNSVRLSTTAGPPAAFRIEMIIDSIVKKRIPGRSAIQDPDGQLSETDDPATEDDHEAPPDEDSEVVIFDGKIEDSVLRNETAKDTDANEEDEDKTSESENHNAEINDGNTSSAFDDRARASAGSSVTRVTLLGEIKIRDLREGADPKSEVLDIDVKLDVDQPFDRQNLPLQAIAVLIDKFVERSVHEVINEVHPIRFVKVTGDGDEKQFVLDRGQDGGLDRGDVLQIVELGDELISASGMSLGQERNTLGTVVIQQVEERFSLAVLSDDKVDFDFQGQDIILTVDRDATHRVAEEERERRRGGVKILAIAPLDFARTDAIALKHSYLSSYLRQGLSSNLKATGRYDVLERRRLGDLLDELKFNNILASQRRGEPDRALNALASWHLVDYVVFVQIDKLYVYNTENEGYSVLRKHREQRKIVAEAQIRLVDVATSAIDVVETLRLDEPIDASDRLLGGAMVDVLTRRIVNLVQEAFPIEIVAAAAENNQWTINRGTRDQVREGDRFNLSKPKEALLVDTSDAVLGHVEDASDGFVAEVVAVAEGTSTVEIKPAEEIKRSEESREPDYLGWRLRPGADSGTTKARPAAEKSKRRRQQW
ncbi:MAG: caspase family protein [Pseudomonadota bacterium]